MATNCEYKISTMTMSTQFPNCALNLANIGKYLDIDDNIIGIKYNHANLSVTKGMYSTTVYKKAKSKDRTKINPKLFYNQITLVVRNGESPSNQTNVKLFGNGSLHITGCKSERDGITVTELVYKKLDALRYKVDHVLLTKDINGVYLDRDNMIYSYNTKQIIGNKVDKTYIIHKREYEIDQKTEMFK